MSPIEELSRPKDHSRSDEGWKVLAYNARVNKSWEELMDRAPSNSLRCYVHLCTEPMKRIPGRVYPLKHKKFRQLGAWEYEVTGGDRVFYVPSPEDRTVLVYYAGEHPPKGRAPIPPELP